MATITPYVTGMEDGAAADGFTCVRDYLVDGTINVGDLPVIGQPYLSQPDWPGSNYVVKSYGRVGSVRQPTGGGVTFDVMRVTGSTNMVGMITGSMEAQIEKGMECGESIQIAPEHLGLVLAKERDYGYWPSPYAYGQNHQFATDDLVPCVTSVVDTTAIADKLASAFLYTPMPNGDPAYNGGYVYRNAHSAAGLIKGKHWASRKVTTEDSPTVPVETGGYEPATFFYVLRTASVGTPSMQHCPFVVLGAPTTTELTISMIGRSFICPTYQVAYYRRTDRYYMTHVPQYPNNGRVTDWGPLAGKKYGPPVASPPPANDGQWRITSQSITGMLDTDGGYLLKIVRGFQRVPYAFPNCYWNPNIYPVWSADWP